MTQSQAAGAAQNDPSGRSPEPAGRGPEPQGRSPEPPSRDSAAPPPRSARSRALVVVLVLVVIGACLYALYYWLVLAGYESTDNAYVQGDMVQVTPQQPGTVTAIGATETDRVKAGDVLVAMDTADARVALDQAQAQLAQAVREVRTLYANNATLAAQIAQREAEVAVARSDQQRAQDEARRRAPLVASGAVAREEYENILTRIAAARSAGAAAESALQAARAELESNRSLTEGTSIERHPNVTRAAGRVHDAYLALRRTELRAPVDGYVARRSVQIGQRVQAGAALMTIVALDRVWVDANFKEVQLRRLRIGQPVTLKADVYGKQIEYRGTIEGLGAGTGAAFALLPAQNATGNWIKVVQRVPVRIALDPKQLVEHPLRVGLSMTARVDIGDTSGRMLSDATRPVQAARVDDAQAARRAADESVRTIIAEHCGCSLAAKKWRMGPHPPLRGAQLVLGTVALSMSTFMTVLDSSIANVSIPSISGDVGVSPEQGTWIITSFGVANAISVPLTGWLVQRFGQVRLMVTIVLLFTIASWLCGLAPNIESLIVFRILQGLVSGPIIPLSQTLILGSYPTAQAGTALAMWSITVLVAPVVGPLLGGWITDNMSWPWIFYINVPIGLLTALLVWTIYREREVPPKLVRIDYVGLALLVVWVGALQMMVDLGKEMDWFASGEIVLLGVVSAVALLLFIAWEVTDAHPVVDIRLFGERNFLMGGIAISVGYGLFFGNVVLLPLWLQQHMGYTPSWAGAALAPVGVFAILMSPWVGRNVARIDPRVLTSVALVAFAVTFWMRARFNVQADLWTVMIPTLVQGIGMAFFFIPLQALMFAGLPPQRMPAATGLSNFVRITAGAIGVSIFTTIWEDRAAMHHARLAESVNPDNPGYRQTAETLSASGLGPDQQLTLINRMIDQQAYTLAATDIFHLSSVLFVLLGLLVWSTSVRRPAPAR